MIHYYIPQYGYQLDELSCGMPAWKVNDPDKTRTLSEVTCHKCLEEIVREGDRAAERIIELDQAAEAEGSSSRGDESAQEGSNPSGRTECTCGQKFRMAEDYRDHLPCDGPRTKEDLVLVHSDGGDCHGVALVPDAHVQGSMYCPVCGITPDMQSTEFWPRSKVKDDWRTRNLTGDYW